MKTSPHKTQTPGPSAGGKAPSYAGTVAGREGFDPLCILVGDTQKTTWFEFWRERNVSATPPLVAEIARRAPGFLLHLGDLTARGQSGAHWRHFDRVFRPLRVAGIPLVPVVGNHEYYGLDVLAFRHYFARFPFLEKRKWRSFRAGDVGFLLLDGNFGGLTAAEDRAQREWFARALADLESDPGVRISVLAVHQPPFSNNRVVGCSPAVRRAFAEPFAASRKALLCVSGHSHAYEHFVEGGVHFVVSGGGGGPRHALALSGNRRLFRDLYAGPAVRFLHFCELRTAEGGLRVDVVRMGQDGAFDVADRFVATRGG
ncbi:MAG: metallophosphoesterase [Acidobacteria bacterium]|nr:metallophosphoesterase [Acidobacteriota bacterium]